MWNRSDRQSIRQKDVPVYTAFAFMLTAPIVNPIVIFRHSSHLAIQRSLPFASTWQLVGGNGGRCLAGLFQ